MADTIEQSLRELAGGTKHRSQTARLRQIIKEVEKAIAAGVRQTAIVEVLNAQGFTFTANSFGTALWRIRNSPKQRALVEKGVFKTDSVSHSPPPRAGNVDPPVVRTAKTPARKNEKTIFTPSDLARARNRDIDLAN